MFSSPKTSALPTPVAPAQVIDAGKIRTGMGFKILPPTAPPASVADSGKIRTGMGFKILPAPTTRVAT